MCARKRRRVRRVVLWSLGGVLTLLLLFAGVALIILHTDYGRDKLRRELEDQLAEVFVRGATIQELDGSPLGTLELRNIVIDDEIGRAHV